ncbi:MAG: CynX/NimT family MFS transporter [Acetobacteraceae bacterium]
MGVRPWFILAALALARIAFGYQFQTIASLGPDLVPRFDLSYAEFGAMIGAYMLLGVFVALPLGMLGRRFGDRIVLGSGLACMVIGACYGAWAGDPAGIALGRSLAGFGAVAMIILQGKIIADFFTGRHFMLAISVSVCSYPIGVGLAQLVLPPLAHAYDWRVALGSGAVLAAIAFVLFIASFRPSPHIAPVTRGFALPSPRECLLLVIGGLIWTFYTAGYAGYLSYVPSSLSLRGDSAAEIGLVMTIATWGNVPPTMFGGGLAARFGALRILLVGTLSLVIGMVGSALTGYPILWSVLVGVVGSIQPGVIMAVGTLSARPENRAVGMAIFYSIYYAGNTLGPTLCGMAADSMGTPEGGMLAASAISVAVIPIFMLHRKLANHAVMLPRP